MTDSPAQARSLWIDLSGSRRHVLEWGQRGAPVLFLQHGLIDHAHNWDWIAERFASAFHIFAPDLRGHGDSDWSRDGAYTLSDYVFDMARIVDALKVSDIRLVGHSLGGQIALRYAATFPETIASLVVIEGIELPIVRDQIANPTPCPQRLRKWAMDKSAPRARAQRFYATEEDARARMAAHNPTIDPDTISHLARHGLVVDADNGLRWKYDNACRTRAPEDAGGHDLDEILASISCPTLLMYGEESWVPLPPNDRLALLRDHEIVTFPGSSHWLHHQSRDAFIDRLSQFLS